MIKVSIPGKIHLIGEHSVVYGKGAILASINLYLHAKISKSTKKEITGIVQYDDAIKNMQTAIEKKIQQKFNIKKIPNYKIEIDKSGISVGSGLGTSASLSAAFSKCLLEFLKLNYSSEDLFEAALEGEKIFHGNPSGGDLAAVLNKGLTYFKKNSDNSKTIRPLLLKKDLFFLLIDSGKPIENTSEMVSIVSSKSKSQKLDDIFNSQDELTNDMIKILKTGQTDKLINLFKKAEKNLEEIGVVGETAKSIIRNIEKLDGAAKITGAGGVKQGSGMILSFHKDLNKLIEFAKNNNLRYYSVQISGMGSHVMKASAKASGNIAFIKYWGKKDPKLNLPFSSSLSVSLDNIYTITTIEFSEKLKKDFIEIDGETKLDEKDRLIKHLDNIRKLAKTNLYAKVVSKNNFPNSSGLASSASGFAALSLAGTKALGLNLNEKELSTLSRLGSGSAARSIPDGFVEWKKGKNHETSFSHSIFPPKHWDLSAIIVMITKEKKSVSTTAGHDITTSSPFFKLRVRNLEKRVSAMKSAIKNKDIQKFGEILEQECLEFVSMSLTATPYILYWEPATIRIMKLCQKLRNEGLTPYFTMDAGPQPVIYCLSKDAKKIAARLNETDGVLKTIICSPSTGTKLTNDHLF